MHQNHGASYNLRPTQRVAMVTLDVTTDYGVMGDLRGLRNWIKPIKHVFLELYSLIPLISPEAWGSFFR